MKKQFLDARLSIGITESGSICAMQKGGDHPLTKEDILGAVKQLILRYLIIRKS